MKIEDISTAKTREARATNTTRGNGIPDGQISKRNTSHPEIAELLNARTSNTLFNCRSLARDEIELASFIISKLDADPQYVPSETLLQAIRTIDDKLSGSSSLHGLIRTV